MQTDAVARAPLSSERYLLAFTIAVERRSFEEDKMAKGFDDMQKLGKDNLDATMKSFGGLSESAQAIAVQMADYSKKSFEDGSKALERLFGAKTLEQVIQIQTDFAKTTYDDFIARATKIGELYSDLAKETYKPFESYLSKTALGT